MKPTAFALLLKKWAPIRVGFRKFILKLKGLQIGERSNIGKISCDWPNKLIIGMDCDIQDDVDFKIWHPFDESTFIQIGDRVFIGHGCEFVCNAKITIGNDCMVASKTTFVDVGHGFERSSLIKSQPVTKGEIHIADDVWIGTSCIILMDVTIGKGSVVAAGSLVNKPIPEYQIWAGVPARFIKNRE